MLETETDPPLREETTNDVFATIGLADPDTKKLYTDLTASFPFISNRGMNYMLILYAYDTNAILVEPTKTRSDLDMFAYFMSHMTH